jgi:hypothetical protein
VNTLFNILAVVIFFGGVNFVATYALVPWWRSPAGVNLMVMTGAVTGLVGLRCVALIFGDGFWGQGVLRVLMGAAVAWAVWSRWRLLVKAQIAAVVEDARRRDGDG